MSLFKQLSLSSNEGKFWNWFEANDQGIFNFESDQRRIFDELQKRLKAVHDSLVFEIGRVVEDQREFIISADGDVEAFPFVDKLFEVAPKLARWNIIKFRPRIGLDIKIKMHDRLLSTDEISFLLERCDDRIDIELFIDGYDEEFHSEFANIAFILLNCALGEYDVGTKLGDVEIGGVNFEGISHVRPFRELPEAFDGMYVLSIN